MVEPGDSMHRLRKAAVALAILVVFGVARWPLESAATRDFKERHLLPPDLGLAMRERLSQNSFVAALGGARSLVASLESLRAYGSWEKQEWGKVENSFRLITDLQPRVPSYWEVGANYLAYDAAGHYRYDWRKHEPATPGLDALRRELWARYVGKGQEMLAEGLRNNPQSWKLAELAGMLWADPLKIQDHRKAAAYYARAAAHPDAPDRLQRFAAYELSFQPDQRGEARRQLKALYDASPRHHLPTLLALLLDLQLEAGVPEADRVPLDRIGRGPAHLLANLTDYTLYRRSRGGDVSPALHQLISRLEDEAGRPPDRRLPPPPAQAGTRRRGTTRPFSPLDEVKNAG